MQARLTPAGPTWVTYRVRHHLQRAASCVLIVGTSERELVVRSGRSLFKLTDAGDALALRLDANERAGAAQLAKTIADPEDDNCNDVMVRPALRSPLTRDSHDSV